MFLHQTSCGAISSRSSAGPTMNRALMFTIMAFTALFVVEGYGLSSGIRFLSSNEEDAGGWLLEFQTHLIGLVKQLHGKMAAMDGQLNRLDERISDIDRKFSVIEELKYSARTTERLVARLDEVKERVLGMDRKISSIEELKDSQRGIMLKLDREVAGMEKLKNQIATIDQTVARMDHIRVKEIERNTLLETVTSVIENLNTSVSKALTTCTGHDTSTIETSELFDQWAKNVSALVSDSVNQHLISFEESMLEAVHDIDQANRNRSTGIAQQATILDKLGSLSSDLVQVRQPVRCEKDGFYSLKGYSPYAIVYPSQQDNKHVKVPLLCDTISLGGGWIVIQRRFDGSVNFYRGWKEFVHDGIGQITGEFWLALDNVHQITSRGQYELRIDIKGKGEAIDGFAHYSTFLVGNKDQRYRLTLGTFDGNIPDAMREHDGMSFTTKDHDYDNWNGGSCAKKLQGGWWYNYCYGANLNGKWQGKGRESPIWEKFNDDEPVYFSEMKIRRVS